MSRVFRIAHKLTLSGVDTPHIRAKFVDCLDIFILLHTVENDASACNTSQP